MRTLHACPTNFSYFFGRLTAVEASASAWNVYNIGKFWLVEQPNLQASDWPSTFFCTELAFQNLEVKLSLASLLSYFTKKWRKTGSQLTEKHRKPIFGSFIKNNEGVFTFWRKKTGNMDWQRVLTKEMRTPCFVWLRNVKFVVLFTVERRVKSNWEELSIFIIERLAFYHFHRARHASDVRAETSFTGSQITA